MYTGCGFLDPDEPIARYTTVELRDLLHREPTEIKGNEVNLTCEGLIPRIQKSMLSEDVDGLRPHVPAFVERAATFATCPE